jgi:hypothetical protein
VSAPAGQAIARVRGDEKIVSIPVGAVRRVLSESSGVPHDSALASYYGLDGFHDGGGFLVLPEAKDDPASFFEGPCRVGVAFPVPRELRKPVVGVCDRSGTVRGTSVPEATVEVHRDASSGEHDVGARSQTQERRDVDTVTEAAAMKFTAHAELEGGVAATV